MPTCKTQLDTFQKPPAGVHHIWQQRDHRVERHGSSWMGPGHAASHKHSRLGSSWSRQQSENSWSSKCSPVQWIIWNLQVTTPCSKKLCLHQQSYPPNGRREGSCLSFAFGNERRAHEISHQGNIQCKPTCYFNPSDVCRIIDVAPSSTSSVVTQKTKSCVF